MNASDIINELPRLTAAERQVVLKRLRELTEQEGSGRLEEEALAYGFVNLRARGIGEVQAADLRARLKTFAADWERPEASIYDED